MVNSSFNYFNKIKFRTNDRRYTHIIQYLLFNITNRYIYFKSHYIILYVLFKNYSFCKHLINEWFTLLYR